MASPATPPAPPLAEACRTGGGLGPRRLLRLTPTQLRNTIAVAFNGRSTPARRVVPVPRGIEVGLVDVDSGPYSTYPANHGLSEFEVRQSLQHAALTGAALVAQLRMNGGVCLASAAKVPIADCAGTLAASKGEVLLHRPLTADEVAHYRGLFTANAPVLGNDDALALMFQAMLLAPQTLFLSELGEGATATRALGQYEIASALAYRLTDWPPDEELWTAARRGELATAEQVKTQVARLLAGAAPAAIRRFVREHFEYEGVLAVFKTTPGYDREALFAETESFVGDVLQANGRRDLLRALLTSSTAYASAGTAPIYGVAAPVKGPPVKVVPTAGERAGILTQPAFLAAFSDMEHNEPVRRGRFVSEKLLCRPVPELPIGQVPELPPADADTPMRARLAAHGKDPACAACHRMMDPLGLAFEIYEHTGKHRARPVDASGTLTDAGTADGPFRDAIDLAARLAGAAPVQRCFATASLRYWMGRDDRPQDACAIAAAESAYVAAGGDYLALVQSLFTSPSFLTRSTP